MAGKSLGGPAPNRFNSGEGRRQLKSATEAQWGSAPPLEPFTKRSTEVEDRSLQASLSRGSNAMSCSVAQMACNLDTRSSIRKKFQRNSAQRPGRNEN